MKKIDLHMHSNYSDDADLSVDVLVQRCISNEIDIISITDHNSIHSINEVKKRGLSENNITIIPGTEIDCSFQGKNFHLLGYGIGNDFSDFELIEKNFFELQLGLTPLKIDKLKALGFFIDEE
ncbi:PHP domain-containing protein [Brenneria tiliae]|uniref:PHP domain-containing protein n=1 Tax=Brenneria tiliae TaxID=2914984 RepID=UPI002014940B|nr:PHP domain-containing protein [Brenneria tiliae]MCL2896222.1 PHP domain-containing protein [Brenneria tiliae]MCL2900838.1 PHP domain-containing protein [Brenneria tiliae]